MAVEEMEERLSTGVDPLDRHLDGGIYPGTTIALSAPPNSQSEPLLHATMRQRPTIYVSTRRDEEAVRHNLQRAFDSNQAEYTVKYAGLTSPLEEVRDAIELPRDNMAVIIDTANPLEEVGDTDRYVRFLNELKTTLIDTNSIAILHCSSTDNPPPARELTQTFADVVWDLTVSVDGTDLENYLSVPKFRGSEIVDETIKLELGESVSVDTSRDIA